MKKTTLRTKPKDAQFDIDGSLYKFGVHALVYIWMGDEWKKSNKTPEDLVVSVYKEVKKLATRLKATRTELYNLKKECK